MNMDSRKLNYILVLSGFCSISLPFVNALKSHCVGQTCPGPTKFYEELGCKPVFKDSKDCCPQRYQCDYFNDPPKGKCIINGHAYESGEKLRDEDRNPCDVCTCYVDMNGYGFLCTRSSCYLPRLRPGCVFGPSVKDCCGVQEVCSPNYGDHVSCEVNGTIYADGEEFIPEDNPDKRCYCGKGMTEENVEEFCITPKHTWCSNTLLNVYEIRQRCSPIYYSNTSPQKDCNYGFRCPRYGDRFKELPNATFADGNFEMGCRYGNTVLGVGEEILRYPHKQVDCVKCVCEVPPTPTCYRYDENECNESVKDK